MERVRVSVNQDDCVSTGRCVSEASSVFQFDADELAEVIAGHEWELPEAVAVRVARNCPNRAIAVHREDGTAVDLG